MSDESSCQSEANPLLVHGPPVVIGVFSVAFFTLFVHAFPVGIYDGWMSASPEELDEVRFSNWQEANETDAYRFTGSYPARYRDSETFSYLLFDVCIRQFRIPPDGMIRRYRNHSTITTNVPRATAAAIFLSMAWIGGWVVWARLLRAPQSTKR